MSAAVAASPASVTLGHRLGALAIACACLAVLLAAARLSPSDSGHGTHVQLGLPPCGWAMILGKPCPTCGMTTAVAHAAQGRPVAALLTQPAGAAVALLTASIFWVCAYVACTGSRLGERMLASLSVRAVWWSLAILLAAWGYKVLTWRG